MKTYCQSRFQSIRRPSREVLVGGVGVGGQNPIRVQSMTTSLTQDVEATVRQCILLAEAGCEIVRVTAPNKAAAEALGPIRRQFSAAGFAKIPLVADIHFLPQVAMIAVEHVEKVRVNPGNYADKKKFAVKSYDDREYERELQRLHDAFSPLVKRAKELGRALRIGTNHGSLSDRIMNRYGDSPLGMVESALEFLRIAESHGFRDLILSMKASNTKVMAAAYRLVVAKMLEEDMHYPLHLGVTEAGEGEDARIKSAIGIGALLYDGLGDTIRVSLTEDPWFEVPVAADLARRAEALWSQQVDQTPAYAHQEQINCYEYRRREVVAADFGPDTPISPLDPPRVITRLPALTHGLVEALPLQLQNAKRTLKDAVIEGLLVRLESASQIPLANQLAESLPGRAKALVLEIDPALAPQAIESLRVPEALTLVVCPTWDPERELSTQVREWVDWVHGHRARLAVNLPAGDVEALAAVWAGTDPQHLIFTTTEANTGSITPGGHQPTHPVGAYRALVDTLGRLELTSPLWIRMVPAFAILPEPGFGPALLEAACCVGNLFIDGAGDLLSVETVEDWVLATNLTYNILQGARMRTVKTEYVACPSCGRTLFNLQEVTGLIKARTGHLKGVTIAVMGCIVNGPGEMADADFGYVGGAPGKINLYVGKECVKMNIPETEALDRLEELIREHGKWVDVPAEPIQV